MQTIVYKRLSLMPAQRWRDPSQTKACASRWGEILEFHTLQNRINLNQVSRVNFSQK